MFFLQYKYPTIWENFFEHTFHFILYFMSTLFMVNLFKQKCIISHHTLTIVPMRVEFVALSWTLVEIFYANIRPSSNKMIFFLCVFFLICLLICFALLLFFFFSLFFFGSGTHYVDLTGLELLYATWLTANSEIPCLPPEFLE